MSKTMNKTKQESNQTYVCTYDSPVGQLTITSNEKAVTGLWVRTPKGVSANARRVEAEEVPVLAETARWLDRYFKGENPGAVPELAFVGGSDFARVVWGLLLEIPYGRLVTYGSLAREAAVRMGRKTMSAQAIGQAVGHNPISILNPCHRVVGSSGSLTGYAGGLDVKEYLLRLEGFPSENLKLKDMKPAFWGHFF